EQAEHVEPRMTGTGKPVAVLGAVRALCPECAHVDVGALARPRKMNRVLAPDPVRRTSDARGTSRGRRYFDTPAERTEVDRRAGSDLLLPAKGIRDVMGATPARRGRAEQRKQRKEPAHQDLDLLFVGEDLTLRARSAIRRHAPSGFLPGDHLAATPELHVAIDGGEPDPSPAATQARSEMPGIEPPVDRNRIIGLKSAVHGAELHICVEIT